MLNNITQRVTVSDTFIYNDLPPLDDMSTGG